MSQEGSCQGSGPSGRGFGEFEVPMAEVGAYLGGSWVRQEVLSVS